MKRDLSLQRTDPERSNQDTVDEAAASAIPKIEAKRGFAALASLLKVSAPEVYVTCVRASDTPQGQAPDNDAPSGLTLEARLARVNRAI